MRRPAALLALLLAASGCDNAPSPAPEVARQTDVFLAPDTTLVRGLVPRHTTLDTMLRGHGVAADAAMRVIEAAGQVFDLRRLRAAQSFSLERTTDGLLRRFEYEIDAARFLRVSPVAPAAEELRAEVLPIPRTLEHVRASGRIDAEAPSLFAAMGVAGEQDDLAIALAGIFAGEIDFNTELQPGDRFALTFERFRRDDGGAGTYGAITAAEFQNEGRVIRAVRFTPPEGEPGYYDEQGRSLKRFFLRSPLKFEPRVTSRFSASRMHPVLQNARAHRGVDYGAPTGAEVVAVAAGTVVGATFDGTNGRMVRLRHPQGYDTFYLHLSAFGAGIRAGVRVTQGQTIGRVGATGLATGPHLHYGLQKNGAWVNPLREHRAMPPGEPVPPTAHAAFAVARDAALDQLAAR